MKAAELDAVTLDAHGTLVTLADPVPALTKVLSERGIERTQEAVLAGFRTEAAHYAPRAGEGHDEESLTRLQRECAGVFIEAVDADLDLSWIVFRPRGFARSNEDLETAQKRKRCRRPGEARPIAGTADTTGASNSGAIRMIVNAHISTIAGT